MENPLIDPPPAESLVAAPESEEVLTISQQADRLRDLITEETDKRGRGPGRLAGTPNSTSMRRQMTHDAIIDFILANPSKTNREVAAAFDYTPVGIGVIIRSDVFQAAYQARKAKFVDPIIMQKVSDRLEGLAHASMDILERKLEASENAGFALKVLETTQRAKGYGVQAPTALQANFVVNLPGPASSTAEWSEKFAPRTAQTVAPRLDDCPSEPSNG